MRAFCHARQAISGICRPGCFWMGESRAKITLIHTLEWWSLRLITFAMAAKAPVRRSVVMSLQGPPRWFPQRGLLACARGVVARPPR